MTFQELQRRFVDYLRQRVRNGELTERGLARLTGISQPHVHNVLKGKRLFSPETADIILRELHLDILEFMEPSEMRQWRDRN